MQDIASPIFNLFNAHQDAHLRFVIDPEPAPAEDHLPPNESSDRKELLNQLGDRLEQLQRLVAYPYTGPSSLDAWPAIDDYHRLTEAILSLAGSLGVKKNDPKHIDGIIHRIDQRYPKLGLLLFVEGLIKKIESVPISPKKRIEQRLVAGVDLQGKKQLSTIYNLMISPEWKVTLPSGSWKELAPLLRELSNGQIQGARNSAKPVTMQDIDFKQADKLFDDAFGLAAFFELQRQHLIWSLRWNDKVFAAATWVSLTYNPS